MQDDNPAASKCSNIDKGPDHLWIRRADGTAECLNCGTRLDPAQCADAFGKETVVNRKAGGEPDAAKR